VRLEAYLDGAYRGRLHGETTTGVSFDEVRDQKTVPGQEDGYEKATKKDRGAFRGFRKVESFDAIDSYKPCWDLLSHKQQEAVRLYHGDGKGLTEVAAILDRTPSSVRGLLDRAQAKKDKHREEMWKKDLEILRELETKGCEE
jgi:DNA-directed RNA polymerase specialized sigma24 family protein